MNSEQPPLKNARAWQEAGIVYMEFPGRARITLPMLEDVYQQRLALLAGSSNRKQKVLTWGTRVIDIDYAASRFAAGKSMAAITHAMAIITQNSLEESLASMFMNMFHPPYPTQVFSKPDTAIAWLHSLPDR